MNGLSFSEVCCLFCCPPCPSRIAAKLAFLPPEPTYTFLSEPEVGPPAPGQGVSTTRVRSSASVSGNVEGRWKLHLMERAEFQYTQRELDTIEVLLTRSSRGNRIGCMYIRCVPNARWALLFNLHWETVQRICSDNLLGTESIEHLAQGVIFFYFSTLLACQPASTNVYWLPLCVFLLTQLIQRLSLHAFLPIGIVCCFPFKWILFF